MDIQRGVLSIISSSGPLVFDVLDLVVLRKLSRVEVGIYLDGTGHLQNVTGQEADDLGKPSSSSGEIVADAGLDCDGTSVMSDEVSLLMRLAEWARLHAAHCSMCAHAAPRAACISSCTKVALSSPLRKPFEKPIGGGGLRRHSSSGGFGIADGDDDDGG
ncbi:unnamed protein product [Lampetra fluviatilis]